MIFRALIRNLKNYVKNNKLAFSVNARLKAFLLKRAVKKLHVNYAVRANKNSFRYSRATSIETFHRKIKARGIVVRPKSYGSLRVFWVGTAYSQDHSGFVQALQRIAEVTVYKDLRGRYGINGDPNISSLITKKENSDALLQQVREVHSNAGIDVLIGQMWAHLISAETLNEIQAMGIIVINVAMDDRLPEHWNSRQLHKAGAIGIAGSSDMVLTTCSDVCLWYGVEGYEALFFPLASDPVLFGNDSNAPKDIDVLFVGNKYGVRSKIVNGLINAGIDVKCYGNGWPNGYADEEKNIALSKRAKIILGVGTVGYTDDVYTLKLRDFDALMTGALYITSRNPDLCKLFVEGRDFECYVDVKEAIQKILFYLSHPKEREEIGRAGRSIALREHSWERRLESIFRELELLA